MTPRRSTSSAPKRSAWRPARRASSAPPMPSGKPKKFSISDVCDACPPGTSRSTTSVDRPSDAAVHGRGEPGRPGPHDRQVVARPRGRGGQAPLLDEPLDAWPPVTLSSPVDHHRQLGVGQAALAEHPVGLGRPGLDPLERLGDPGQEVAQAVVLGLEPPADDGQGRAQRAHAVMMIDALQTGLGEPSPTPNPRCARQRPPRRNPVLRPPGSAHISLTARRERCRSRGGLLRNRVPSRQDPARRPTGGEIPYQMVDSNDHAHATEHRDLGLGCKTPRYSGTRSPPPVQTSSACRAAR